MGTPVWGPEANLNAEYQTGAKASVPGVHFIFDSIRHTNDDD